ncbi:hypothetical protein D3C79_827090 [compost metagenome]
MDTAVLSTSHPPGSAPSPTAPVARGCAGVPRYRRQARPASDAGRFHCTASAAHLPAHRSRPPGSILPLQQSCHGRTHRQPSRHAGSGPPRGCTDDRPARLRSSAGKPGSGPWKTARRSAPARGCGRRSFAGTTGAFSSTTATHFAGTSMARRLCGSRHTQKQGNPKVRPACSDWLLHSKHHLLALPSGTNT